MTNENNSFTGKVALVTGGTSAIAAAVLYLASDAAKFTTGTSLVTDGGLVAG